MDTDATLMESRTMFAKIKHLWRMESGLGEVFWLSLPLIVSTLSWTVMHFFDRVFLIWYSADAVAAALPAGVLSFAVVCFPLGVAAYINTFVSQYYGAGQHGRIGVVVWQGVWIGLAISPLVLLTNYAAPTLFAASDHSPEIAALETTYYQAMSWAAGAMVISAALSSFFTGRGGTRTVMIVDSLASLVDLVLDYCWIFGYWGFPEGGIAGAAWSTVVGQWIKVVVYLVLFLLPRFRGEYQTLAGCRFDADLFRRLLRFGSPNGVQFLSEIGGFTLFLLMVGRLGKLPLAASSLAFNVNSLAFMPVYGIGIATTTLVGQRLGRNRPDLAARATWSAFALAQTCMLVVGALYVLVPGAFLYAYGVKASAADFADLKQLTTELLRFVAFYCLFDAMNVVFSSAIKGAGDTRFVLITTLIVSPLPVLATWAGVEFFGLGLFWAWIAVTAWVSALGAIYMARFMQGKWRTMRVIEHAPTVPDLDDDHADEPQEEVAAVEETV